MRALAGAPTLHALIQESMDAAAARAQGSLNRGDGEIVEAEMAARLTPETQKTIAKEAVKALKSVPSFGRVKSISWQWLGGGRKACDFFIHVVASEREVVLPLNVKTRSTGVYQIWNHAVSVKTLLRVAMGQPIVGREARRFNTERVILEFAAGLRRIQPGDYFLLDILSDRAGKMVSVHSQGLLSHVMQDGDTYKLSFKRHVSRPADLESAFSMVILPDDFDVNAAFVEALLPRKLTDDELALQELARLRANGATASSLKTSAKLYLGA